MAATLTWANGVFDPFTRDQASLFRKMKMADGGDGTAAERATALNELNGAPDFKAEIQATTDTSDLEALDLTTEGVTFPARTIREIRGKSWCLTDNDTYFYEWTENVLGGTTPVLLGQKIVDGWAEEAGVPWEYGDVHFAATITALTTITVIHASKGLALGDIASGDGDLAVPKNRLLLTKQATLDGSVIQTAATGNLVVIDYTNLDGLGAGTDAVKFVAITTSVVTGANPVVGARLDLAFEVWPPHNHRLVMDTNNVTVKCAATNNIGDDNLKHYVEIFVGPAKTIGYSAA